MRALIRGAGNSDIARTERAQCHTVAAQDVSFEVATAHLAFERLIDAAGKAGRVQRQRLGHAAQRELAARKEFQVIAVGA